MTMKPGSRPVFLLVFLACMGLLGFALYLQETKHLLPCPLCIVQRVAYWLVGLTALLGFLHNPRRRGRWTYSALLAIFALAGAVVALRQAWLVRHPLALECGISPEEQFLNALPLSKWWPAMFEANGDCTVATWKFLSLTMPDWSLIWFAVFGGLAAYAFFARGTRG
jgi:disulfide bond formation protein DsbB